MLTPSDPLRRRSYIHFDEPPDRKAIEAWVSNPAKVAKWQFLPLISLVVRTKKVKGKDKVTGKFEIKQKDRPICYASHRDAALYGFYAGKVSQGYEAKLKAEGLSGVVTAFRPANGRCNIHFATDAFKWISKNTPCVALAYDISGFFDNLDHGILRRKMCHVLSVESLPADFYAVFRSLTRFVRVDRDAVYGMFDISKNNPRSGGRTRICSADEFRTKVVDGDLLLKHPGTAGIPQGTPISALLSNVYMLDFDRTLQERVAEWGGLYRRYCDDILCVVPPEHKAAAAALVDEEIAKVKLTAQPDKQGEFHFTGGTGSLSPPLQYLGLTFDGQTIRLRVGGIARFYSRMRGAVNAAAASRNRVATEAGKQSGDIPIKRGKLLGGYTYAGRRNFISYALRAAKISESPAIKRQVSRHVPALAAAIASKDDAPE